MLLYVGGATAGLVGLLIVTIVLVQPGASKKPKSLEKSMSELEPKSIPREDLGVHNLIVIPEVFAVGKPVFEEYPCDCGGVVEYNQFSLSSFLNHDEKVLEVKTMWAHGCKTCGTVVAFHPDVADELEWRVDKARGSLTLSQKIKDFINPY